MDDPAPDISPDNSPDSSTETPPLTKQTLRQEALRHRDRILTFGNENVDDACTNFFEALHPQAGHVVAAYWPLEKEFDPGAILERLLAEGIECALPVVRKGTKLLGFARWRDGDRLVAGPFGILQPAENENTVWVEPDIVIVPLLAFDRRGGRLGYGGGYYDSTLRDLRTRRKILAVGVGFAQQAVIFNLPAEPHDEKLDWVITPRQAHFFGA